MKKPHIRKIKGSPYWVCSGFAGRNPMDAYMCWKSYFCRGRG